ncbi:MAG TPA: putative toxin-antitoxin system toxin component, PIN family [Burkholderiales bacterium]|jgi:putative PIN family toxin of toxin-antitoxin system|nr:putative toxin-antitoxin system toxin component, PIN family [Burkholderiales bacterium]
MRVVLDTNVWLDWLVFDGNEVAALRAACAAKSLQPVIDAACMDELARVLAYPAFALGPEGIRHRLGRARRLSLPHEAGATPVDPALPRCRDRDDQKFLALAHAAGAGALVTRDKALLCLAGRARRRFGFDIVEPRGWPPQP